MTQIQRPTLELEKVVPDFSLPTLGGEQVGPGRYKQRANLLIAYLDFDRCSSGVKLVETLAGGSEQYHELETEVIVVSPQPLDDLRGRIGTMSVPFPVASDESGKVARAYFGEGAEKLAAAIFVTDRYGALRAQFLAASDEELPPCSEILGWLNLIEMECPECGH